MGRAEPQPPRQGRVCPCTGGSGGSRRGRSPGPWPGPSLRPEEAAEARPSQPPSPLVWLRLRSAHRSLAPPAHPTPVAGQSPLREDGARARAEGGGDAAGGGGGAGRRAKGVRARGGVCRHRHACTRTHTRALTCTRTRTRAHTRTRCDAGRHPRSPCSPSSGRPPAPAPPPPPSQWGRTAWGRHCRHRLSPDAGRGVGEPRARSSGRSALVPGEQVAGGGRPVRGRHIPAVWAGWHGRARGD